MKIKQLKLRNYKKFRQEIVFSFTGSENEVNEKTLLLGENGSGKSSILQAIVLLVASATRQHFKPENLDWPGYSYRHIHNGSLPLQMEAEILFSPEEIATTQEYVARLRSKGMDLNITPSGHESVTLYMGDDKILAKQGRDAFFQFNGYQYAKSLTKMTTNKNELFNKVGNIYWYHEQRNSHNISNLLDNNSTQLDDVKNFLSVAYNYHLAVKNNNREIKEGEFDFYAKLETLYTKVFPNRSFVGAAPDFELYEKAKAPDFYLNDGFHEYELSCMSAGERAIFPILMDFARWNINNSIIIIDELELHLHPPLQQGLLTILPMLGKNNQFIFTSHSDYLVVMFDTNENEIIRLSYE